MTTLTEIAPATGVSATQVEDIARQEIEAIRKDIDRLNAEQDEAREKGLNRKVIALYSPLYVARRKIERLQQKVGD
jgi:hypothetical protein